MTRWWTTFEPQPKSARFASMPESTIAIAGGFTYPHSRFRQSLATSETCAHFCLFWYANSIGPSGVIAETPFMSARRTISRPESCAARPFTLVNCARSCCW